MAEVLRHQKKVVRQIGILFLFWLHRVACRILVPQPGIEPVSPALEARSLNHWTAREVPDWHSLILMISVSLLLARGLLWEHVCLRGVCMVYVGGAVGEMCVGCVLQVCAWSVLSICVCGLCMWCV